MCQHSSRGLASTRQTRQHLPTWFARTRQTRRHLPTCFAWTRQTRWHLPKAIFEKNVTHLDTFARVMSESREFGASGHCLHLTHKNLFCLTCKYLNCQLNQLTCKGLNWIKSKDRKDMTFDTLWERTKSFPSIPCKYIS